MRTLLGTTLLVIASFGAAYAFQETRDETAESDPLVLADRLWLELQEADYTKAFSAWPGQEKDAYYAGRSPHGAHLKLFVNAKVADSPDALPYGSIIVKENYTPEKELAAITVMYRREGFDPTHHDWFWAKYQPDGKIALLNNEPLVGRPQGCIDCHARAKAKDLVFANDKQPAVAVE